MASWVAALLFAAGASAWIYNVMMKQTGSNTKAALTLTFIAFIFSFFIFWSIFDFVAGMAK